MNLTAYFFHQDYDSNEKFPIQVDRISHLLPAFFQDKIVRVYAKKPELVCPYTVIGIRKLMLDFL